MAEFLVRFVHLIIRLKIKHLVCILANGAAYSNNF